ncbi:MAG TPA: cation:proton antiporter [Anaerolineae bacterium]
MVEWLQQLTPPADISGPTLTAYILLDVFLIIVLARFLGGAMVQVGQPRVVGEILAGILLGPTLLGPELSQVVAPQAARPVLSAIATIGLILFMFLAGVEFDAGRVKGRARQAGVLALLSVAAPALLGFPVARAMHSPLYTGPAGESLLPFALLIGAALSVTAFPVMAHILMERGELNTAMGALAVATAGIMSVLMFTYIAFAGAVAAANGFGSLLLNVALMVLFGLGSWFIVRPLIGRLLQGTIQGNISGNGMAIVFGGMVLYGLIADRIGINALVGGFVWGLILPDDTVLRRAIAAKIADVALIFFLPVFFATAGFFTDLKLITLETLPVVGLVLLAAVVGKFMVILPARSFGLSWREGGVLGALFNTRGLLVIVVGLIGLQLGIITNLTFTITVVVALVTNLMTLPLLNLLARPQPQVSPALSEEL